MNSLKSIIFISTGRTGTKFFYNFFKEQFPSAKVYHDSPYSTLINALSNAYLAKFIPKNALTVTWKVLKQKEISQCGNNTLIDSNNHLYALAFIAPELYPNLKIIQIVRDPRSYVCSHLSWAQQRKKSYIANYWLPFWQPNAYFLKEMSFNQWRSLSKFEQFCWIWDFKNRYMTKIAATNTPYCLVKFEDFFSNTNYEDSLNKLLSFMELPKISNTENFFKTPINDTKIKVLPEWDNWPDLQCAKLDKICGEQMKKLGYGLEPEWQVKVQHGKLELDSSKHGR